MDSKDNSSNEVNGFEAIDMPDAHLMASKKESTSLESETKALSQQVYQFTTEPIDKPLPRNADLFDHLFAKFGKWQLRSILSVFIYKIPAAWFMHCILFTAPAPRYGEYFCQAPQNLSNIDLWIDMAHPSTPATTNLQAGKPFTRDFCHVFSDANYRAVVHTKDNVSWTYNNFTDEVIPCESHTHIDEYESIVTEFDLVCSREILIATTQFLHLVGVSSGGTLAIILLNYVSPKKLALGGMSCMLLFGPLTGLVNRYELHVIFRLLAAASIAHMVQAAATISQDITVGKYRILVTALHEIFWGVGVILLPGLTFFFSSWTYLYFAMTSPALILLLLYRYVPDSPRWHADRGHVNRAMKIIQRFIDVDQKHNDPRIPDDLYGRLQDHANKMEKKDPGPSLCVQFRELWKGTYIWKRNLACVHFAIACYIVSYFGMLLNAKSFGRERLQINTMLMGVAEICGVFIGTYLILNKGRYKWRYVAMFNLVTVVISMCAWLVPATVPEAQRVSALVYISFFPKTAISAALTMLVTCNTEVVTPDKKKIAGLSVSSCMRIFQMSTPYWGALLIFGQLVPQTCFAVLSTLGAIACLLIRVP
ncbi:solute carrier family 22 member 7-like [Bradysia coprophila]|uniref:solute carrier family 22 member 7-like n=1 Tax=Bradysia coprophila TaxID=38358 RepID=UPI00187DC9E6|nr:solute carrier family 22 member 7-like [Bradysia coprophila]